MNGELDTEFVSLQSNIDAGEEFFLTNNFKIASFDFFDHQDQDDWEAFDRFFNRFYNFWSEEHINLPFRVLKNYDELQDIFDDILNLTHEWEHNHPSMKVHKGTPYYFYGMAAIKYGDIDKGLLLIHQAAEEDRRYGRTTSPALSFIILDDENTQQFFKSKVKITADFLETKLQEYRNIHSALNTCLDLKSFRKKFLLKDKYIDDSYLFIYSIFKYHNFITEIEQRYRKNPLASYIETNIIFDLCKLCEVILKKIKNETRYQDLHSCYNEFCHDPKVRLRLGGRNLINLGNLDANEFKTTLKWLLNRSIRQENKFPSLLTPKSIEYDITLAYGLRNFSAHKIQVKKVIYDNFEEVVQSILNTFFFIVEKKLPEKNI